jgi:RNA polymerase sigma factor (TIGR02999 family)
MHGTSARDRIGELLKSVEQGDRSALDELFPLVYDELRVLARQHRRSWHGDDTLNTTAVVHEVYLKVVDLRRLSLEGRTHFLGVASKAMRHVLCNYARDRRRLKRGGGIPHLRLEPGDDLAHPAPYSDEEADTLAALDESLRDLEQVAERQARVVECRFFGGLSVDDTAAVLGISQRTVKRDWTFARAWLKREMEQRLA